jgi:hypothetical protein
LLLVAQPAFAQRVQRPPESRAERAAYCAKLPESKRRQTDICKSPEEREEDAREARRKELDELERPTHTSFIRKLYLDGLWIPTTMGTGQYGLVGTHLDVVSAGRLHVFGPPGLMLVAESTGNGWRLKPSLTWGFSVLIGDVRLPGSKSKPQLFFNMAKSWSAGNFQLGRDLAGLSLSWKK